MAGAGSEPATDAIGRLVVERALEMLKDYDYDVDSVTEIAVSQ